ncbi:energy transducer TonB [Altererythrobacter lutimaris]|uniref:Energy transducer TonB n=1 Tax=Altererythrobacter lutimaris TaxID=2743979 RepID=A0A850HFC5_9SPHN|nr:TonB C-terminal domain-containing protein [Altererythrobacter lutimaris]NVE95971.1 energy transducer TonB [Altererythrobacter lutimaris]
MQAIAANREERIGLGVALGLHLALVLVFLIQPSRGEIMPLPERMTVSLASNVGLEDTAPAIVPESRAAIASELADTVTAPAPEDVPDVTRSPDTTPTTTTTATRPQPRTNEAPPERSTGSRIGDNFLTGSGDSTSSEDARIPASQIGASAQASLRQAISRQIKPHWNAPSGLDAEQLITILAFRLNEDGTLAGRPRVVRQAGINASNRPQADLHAERAIRAVQRAAPFDLPPEYYNAWRNVSEWRFDRRL